MDLLFPAQCPCGEWDTPACSACLEEIGPPREVTDLCPALAPIIGPVWRTWALANYLGPVGPLIRAWKGRPDAPLTRHMTARISTAVGTWLPDGVEGELVVVPAPSAPRRYRSATFIAGDIADAVARSLATHGLSTMSADVFYPRRGHQKGRTRSGRGARAPMRVRGGGGVALVVDDVVTTGSTMADCCTALSQAGYEVLGGLCVASARWVAEGGETLKKDSSSDKIEHTRKG